MDNTLLALTDKGIGSGPGEWGHRSGKSGTCRRSTSLAELRAKMILRYSVIMEHDYVDQLLNCAP